METESSLSSYHIFNAVAETGNLSKAAKMLYISQPAISRAVSKLEQSLSVRLFIRNSRGVHLTEEGKLLYEHTKTAFDSLRKAEEGIKRIHNLGAGRLCIGVDSFLYKHVLMPRLQEFIQTHPHIQINLKCISSSEAVRLLEDGDLDIALISEPFSLHTLEFLPVAAIHDIFVASSSYIKNFQLREQDTAAKPSSGKNRRSVEKKASASSLLLKDGVLMLPEKDTVSRAHIESYFIKNQVETGRILEFDNPDMLVDFAKIGMGISCVVKEFIKEELENKTLTELPLPSKPDKRTVGFAYNKTSLQAEAVHKFLDFYKGGIQ